MSAEVYDLGLFRELNNRNELLSTLAFIKREIRRMREQERTSDFIKATGLPHQTRALKEQLLGLPDRPRDTSPEQALVNRLRSIYASREHDVVTFIVGVCSWEDDLQAHFGQQEAVRYGK